MCRVTASKRTAQPAATAPLPSWRTAKSGAAQKRTTFFTAEHWLDFPEGAPLQ
jgi:hypothetical protein